MAAKTSSKTTTTKRPSRKPPAATTPETTEATAMAVETRGPTTDEIKRRAFELYVARGGEHGRAQEDWLTAERELRDRYSVS